MNVLPPPTMSSIIPPDTSTFYKERHIKYWLRCLKTHLPTGYTSNDSNRVMLACFTVSALDLLGVLYDRTTDSERAGYIDWVYRCQHPDGGFRGFTGTEFSGSVKRGEENKDWDPANLAGTYFALAALLVLGDDLGRVRRRECWEWARTLQCDDGSFGEMTGNGGMVEGAGDVRFCFLATLVRYILWGDRVEEQDIDVEKLARFIQGSQTYDGGIAKAPFHEAHAGWTYCGMGALSLLGKLPNTKSRVGTPPGDGLVTPEFLENTLRWLVNRQTSVLQDDSELNLSETNTDAHSPPSKHDSPSFHILGASPAPPEIPNPHRAPLDILPSDLQWAGFNGRCNKVADTCYSFWVGATLGTLQKVHLLSFNANRRYLLEKTQHMIGGFGKLPGLPPDILHSYLGLAALATMGEPSLKSLDPVLCISVSAREHLESLLWRKGRGRRGRVFVDGDAVVRRES